MPDQGGSAGSGGSFPADGGELAALIRQFDWASTGLGPLSAWPQSLKTVTETLLRSPVPIVLLWGPDGIMIYNDAYSGICRRPPSAVAGVESARGMGRGRRLQRPCDEGRSFRRHARLQGPGAHALPARPPRAGVDEPRLFACSQRSRRARRRDRDRGGNHRACDGGTQRRRERRALPADRQQRAGADVGQQARRHARLRQPRLSRVSRITVRRGDRFRLAQDPASR